MRPLSRLVTLLALCSCSFGKSKAHAVTFYEDVEPIVQTKCQGCHLSGGIAPFSLDSFSAVSAHADRINYRVQRKEMPPWLPSERSEALLHARSLSQEQIDIIAAWVKAGAPEGSASDHQNRGPNLQTIRADVEIAMADPYTPRVDLTDDYRCFVLDPHLGSEQSLTGYNIIPGNNAIVHHVILFSVADQGDALKQLDALDAADPGPGFSCFGDVGIATEAVKYLGGWAPGVGAVSEPRGTGIALPAGSRIVMQVHYNTTNGRSPDLTRAQLEFSKGQILQATLLPLVNDDLVIPAGERGVEVRQDYKLGSLFPPVVLYNVFPHMHVHGVSISVSVTQADGETMVIDIPRWDFHWQTGYDLARPLVVKPGDTVHLRCTYDNSPENQPVINGQLQAPKDLHWGEATSDEMCLAFFYTTY